MLVYYCYFFGGRGGRRGGGVLNPNIPTLGTLEAGSIHMKPDSSDSSFLPKLETQLTADVRLVSDSRHLIA